jgi:tetratricopeptide (TPR) repeat protein
MTDVNAEYLRYRNFCTSAAAALQAGDFAAGSEQFSQALQMARQYSPRSSDEASCLQGLAESYFGQHKFAESKKTYQELEQLLESWGETATERRFNISLQLARCHEKLREFDQACAIYSKAMEVAEVALRYGDQKMTNILESYASALRSARKDPNKLAEIEQKTRLSLSRQGNPQFLSSITSKETEQISKPVQSREGNAAPNTRQAQTYLAVEAEEQESKFAALQALASEHPRIAMGCVTVLLIGLVQILCLVSAINDIKGNNPLPPSSPATIGKIYTSADGKETITFMEHGKVQINGAAGLTNARCYVVSPGWSELIATMIMQKPNQVWLVPNSQGLKDYKGNKQLYDLKACPILDLPPRMNVIARACQLYTVQYKKYPEASNLLGTIPGITDKLSDGKEYLPVIVSGNKEVMVKDIHKFLNDRTIDLVHEKLPVSKIVCVTMPDDKTQKMIIVATDSAGVPFKSQSGIELAIALSDGELSASDGLNTRMAYFDHLPKSIVISASAPDFIRHLYVDFIFVLASIIVLALAAFKLKSMAIANSRGESLPHKIKVVAWLVWSIIAIVILYRLEETCSAYLFRG